MIPQQAIDLVKRFEGFSAITYVDSAGVPTIGYGTTARAEVGIIPIPGMEISEKQAEKYLMRALEKFAKKIRPFIEKPMTDNQWSAFLSLAYNIGPHGFTSSSALALFNLGKPEAAADAILMWDRAGGRVLRGLQRRRAAERALFLTPDPEPKPKGLWALIWAFLSSLQHKRGA